MTDEKDAHAFMADLMALCRKHGATIISCGCCDGVSSWGDKIHIENIRTDGDEYSFSLDREYMEGPDNGS